MLAYVDSSVLLRKIFAEPDPLAEMSSITYAISSELTQTECLRTADRFRISNKTTEADYLKRVDLIYDALKHIELIRISPEILRRASQPFPSTLATLDAIHLSTCLIYRERSLSLAKQHEDIVLCSHDEDLKRAAKSVGIRAIG